jgi:hypothetical protein
MPQRGRPYDPKFETSTELNSALYWYVHSFLWGRYVGPTETLLNQDLDAVDKGGFEQLIELLRLSRGDLTVRATDFSGYGMGARFYPLLYLLTRVGRARYWWNGAPELSAHMLGKLSKLQVHHIFPKARLYAAGFTRGEVNAIANFCFLTQETNLWVTDREPAEYFAVVEEHFPGALASQWIPDDPSLWTLDRYSDFLEARRQLLANAANSFLESLLAVPAQEEIRLLEPIVVGVEPEEDPEILAVRALVDELVEAGYAKPDLDVEVADPETGESIVVAEAAWMSGLQEGLGDPVLLELELTEQSESRLVELGFRVFPSVAALRGFVDRLSEGVLGVEQDLGAVDYAGSQLAGSSEDASGSEGRRTVPHDELIARSESEFVRRQVDGLEEWIGSLGVPGLHVRHNLGSHHSIYLGRRHLAGYYFARRWVRFWLSGRIVGDEADLQQLSEPGRVHSTNRQISGNLRTDEDLAVFQEQLRRRLPDTL